MTPPHLALQASERGERMEEAAQTLDQGIDEIEGGIETAEEAAT